MSRMALNNVSWENTCRSQHRWWEDVNKFRRYAEQGGYRFFEWNGSIYETHVGFDPSRSLGTVEEMPGNRQVLPDRERVAVDVADERVRQDERWGEQNHNLSTWVVILTEEVGEFAKDALAVQFAEPRTYTVDGAPRKRKVEHVRADAAKRAREEVVQVAAVASAIAECIDRNQWAERYPTVQPEAESA